MNNSIVKINNQSVSIKEYNGFRVVTFRDIDAVHGRPEGTARRNFNEHKKRLIQDVDYFVRNSYEAKNEFGIVAPNGLTLLAESGYLMLVKSFMDDLAWEVQRQLVNKYFKDQTENTGKPSAYHKALAEAKLNNSRARLSAQWLKLADRVNSPEYKQICASYAGNVLAGREVLPLPTAKQRYMKAGEIGDMLGISANMVGKIANAHGLKTEQYGKWFHDKSPHSNKEVDSFRYNDMALDKFREILLVPEAVG